jgi:hypothetical protein
MLVDYAKKKRKIAKNVQTLLVVLNESSLGTYWMSYTKKEENFYVK